MRRSFFSIMASMEPISMLAMAQASRIGRRCSASRFSRPITRTTNLMYRKM